VADALVFPQALTVVQTKADDVRSSVQGLQSSSQRDDLVTSYYFASLAAPTHSVPLHLNFGSNKAVYLVVTSEQLLQITIFSDHARM
jgi:hypothetical protein